MVRNDKDGDRAQCLRMRKALWGDCPDEQQVREMDEILDSGTEEVFFAERPGDGLCDFVETSIRPWAINCEARPVGYIEGWYVDPDMRRRGRCGGSLGTIEGMQPDGVRRRAMERVQPAGPWCDRL
jgi:aminoglycoside 6'-N-acetyltransferase I